MGWLQDEPTLEDVFSDPTVHVLMERDDVDPDDLRMFLEDVKSALEERGMCRQLASDVMPRSLRNWEPSLRHASGGITARRLGKRPGIIRARGRAMAGLSQRLSLADPPNFGNWPVAQTARPPLNAHLRTRGGHMRVINTPLSDCRVYSWTLLSVADAK